MNYDRPANPPGCEAASRFEPAFPFPFFLSLPSPVHTCLLTWPVTSVGWVVQRVNLPSPFLPMDDGVLDAHSSAYSLPQVIPDPVRNVVVPESTSPPSAASRRVHDANVGDGARLYPADESKGLA